MATLSVGGTTVFDGATLQAASLTSATFPAGHVLQVQHTDYTTQTSFTALTDLVTITITPKASGSDFIIHTVVVMGLYKANTTETNLFVKKDNDYVGASISHSYQIAGSYWGWDANLDYPHDAWSHSAWTVTRTLKTSGSTKDNDIVFKLQADSNSTASTYINRAASSTASGAGVTSMTIYEIKGA